MFHEPEGLNHSSRGQRPRTKYGDVIRPERPSQFSPKDISRRTSRNMFLKFAEAPLETFPFGDVPPDSKCTFGLGQNATDSPRTTHIRPANEMRRASDLMLLQIW